MPDGPKALLKRLLRRVFTERLLREAGFEARAFLTSALTRRAVAKRCRAMTDVRLHVGCGGRPIEGWTNLDLVSHPGVEYWDCRRGLPFGDGAVVAIFSEHFLEHLDPEGEAQDFLRECLRCLRPEGVLRISVPDAGAYLKDYAAGGWDALARRRGLAREGDVYRDPWIGDAYATRMQLVNAVFRQRGEHRYAYDTETLIQLLRGVGFRNAAEAAFGQSSDPRMAADSADRRPESLYVEASKA